MRDLESVSELDEENSDLLHALRKKFNCLPYITNEQKENMKKLKRLLKNGQNLSPYDMKELNRLR